MQRVIALDEGQLSVTLVQFRLEAREFARTQRRFALDEGEFPVALLQFRSEGRELASG